MSLEISISRKEESTISSLLSMKTKPTISKQSKNGKLGKTKIYLINCRKSLVHEVEYLPTINKIKLCSNTVSVKTNLFINLNNVVGIFPFTDKIYDVKNSISFLFELKEYGKISGRVFSNGTVVFSGLKYLWSNIFIDTLMFYIYSLHNLFQINNVAVIYGLEGKNVPTNYKYITYEQSSTYIVNFDVFLIDYKKMPLVFTDNTQFSIYEESSAHIEDYKVISCKNELSCGAGFFVKFLYSKENLQISFTVHNTGSIQARATAEIDNLKIRCDHFISILDKFRSKIEYESKNL